MREININIEGYNVNGICVGCLNYNRKMFYQKEVKECFKNLADIDVPDDLTIQVCWECLAAVHAAKRFQDQILRSYEVLSDYSQKHTFLNSPQDLSQFAAQRLTTSTLEIDPPTIEWDSELKTEIEIDVKSEVDDDKFDIHFDDELLKSETDYTQDTVLSVLQSPDQDASSEDEIQLSQLKKRKERKERKIRKVKKIGDKVKSKETKVAKEETPKNLRMLKNLPPDLVELYTMTEEEMWQVRSQDLASKEFSKLKYKCEHCIIGFNTERLMRDHMSGKHRPKGPDCHQCDVCRAYFLTRESAAAHRALHLRAFRCVPCARATALKRRAAAHARAHAPPASGPGAPAPAAHQRCPKCGQDFPTKSKLAYHKNVCHQDKPQCDCCGKVFANKMTLKYHLKILPQNKEEKPKEKLHIPCKGCNKVFHSKKSYRAHVVIHDGLTYPCPVCGKLFHWKRNLARHARNHRERDAGARHECRECRKTFASRDCYVNHMRLSKRHVPDHQYSHECNYCGKKFAAKWCMIDHIDWDHLKRIKYQCSVCFKAFKTGKIMVAHMNNIHEGKRSREPDGDHLCEICGKSYKTVKRLKGHVWAMHTNRSTTKSFKCKLCPATFTWQTSIYKHTKMMHDATKRAKQTRAAPVKKQEQYTDMEVSSRMQYFQQGLPALPPHLGHAPPPQIPLVHNI